MTKKAWRAMLWASQGRRGEVVLLVLLWAFVLLAGR